MMIGDVTIKSAKGDVTLRLTAAALCEIEEKTGQSFLVFFRDWSKEPSVGGAVIVIQASAVGGKTKEESMALIDEIGVPATMEVLGALVEKTFAATEKAAGTPKEKKTKAAR